MRFVSATIKYRPRRNVRKKCSTQSETKLFGGFNVEYRLLYNNDTHCPKERKYENLTRLTLPAD